MICFSLITVGFCPLRQRLIQHARVSAVASNACRVASPRVSACQNCTANPRLEIEGFSSQPLHRYGSLKILHQCRNPAPTSTLPISKLGSISPRFIHQFSRSRWRIDTEVFQTLTTDCHLKHPAVHQTTALVVLTMIRFLAYTLSLVFYHRQVRSHARRKCDTFHELAKRLAYWFLAVSPNTS
jgi:hypothetical protein